MTCTTAHHACDCVLKRMKKLEAVVEAAKNHANATIEYRLNRISELEMAAIYNKLLNLISDLEQE
jgi:hypothetical protein